MGCLLTEHFQAIFSSSSVEESERGFWFVAKAAHMGRLRVSEHEVS